MKFLNAIVDFLMGTSQKTKTENENNVHYASCSELFGKLSNVANARCLDYDYVSEDFVFTEVDEFN